MSETTGQIYFVQNSIELYTQIDGKTVLAKYRICSFTCMLKEKALNDDSTIAVCCHDYVTLRVKSIIAQSHFEWFH